MINNDQMLFTSSKKLKMSSRKCKYDPDAFCFICGQFIKVRDVKYELKTSNVLCEAYEANFTFPFGIKISHGLHMLLVVIVKGVWKVSNF